MADPIADPNSSSFPAEAPTLNFFGTPATPLTLHSQNDARAAADELAIAASTAPEDARPDRGLASDAPLTSTVAAQDPASGAPQKTDLSDMGPASTMRSATVTRSKSSPNITTAARAPVAAAPIAQTPPSPPTNPHTPSPDLNSSTFTRFGLKAYVSTDNRKETSAPMAMRAAGNIQVLAEVVRTVETSVGEIARDLKNLKIEVRLRDETERTSDATTLLMAPEETPPPPSTSTPDEGDDDDVVARLEEVEYRTNRLRDRNDETDAALAAIQKTALPQNVVAGQLSDVLHAALMGRFDAITRDRDILDSNTQHHAVKQEKVTTRQSVAIDEFRTENVEPRAKLCAIEATIARLSLGPPAPIRSRSRSPERRAAISRSRSPFSRESRAPARMRETRFRSRSVDVHRDPKRSRKNEPSPPVITMGPFQPSTMSAVDLFETHIHAAIPDHFRPGSSRPYQVERDPVMTHSLRVSMQTVAQVKALTSAWASNNVPGYYITSRCIQRRAPTTLCRGPGPKIGASEERARASLLITSFIQVRIGTSNFGFGPINISM
ncbi:hypothetical protein C8J57DRAFT_1540777 [Mycena rebaudengoi]|nr:hypothetical protein C8J57DRAFT_1540777 [Mycena rebaudengoi]